MKKLTLFIGLTALSSVAVQAQDTKIARAGEKAATGGKTYFVVAAVTNYANVTGGFTPLKKAVDDSIAIVTRCSTEGSEFIPYLLTKNSDSETTPADRHFASVENIRYVLKEIAGKITSRDRIVVVLSGHGFQNRDGSVFAAYGCMRGNPKSFLSVSEVKARLTAMPGKEKVLFVEACRNPMPDELCEINRDGLTTEAAGNSLTAPKAESSMIVIQSCEQNLFAYQRPEVGGGIASQHLLEALDGKADTDKDGLVTISEMLNYLKTRVEDDVLSIHKVRQRISVEDLSVGKPFVLAKCKIPTEAETAAAAAAATTPAAPIDTKAIPFGAPSTAAGTALVNYGNGAAMGYESAVAFNSTGMTPIASANFGSGQGLPYNGQLLNQLGNGYVNPNTFLPGGQGIPGLQIPGYSIPGNVSRFFPGGIIPSFGGRFFP